MLNLNSIMVGSSQPQVMAEFYEKVLQKPADMHDGNWWGWSVGGCYLSIAEHSEVKGKNQNPAQILFNFETKEVKEEFERIKSLGATVIKEVYEIEGHWIATFADPDGNYFQLASPWN